MEILGMSEKTKFTVGGVSVLLNKEEIEGKLRAVMPEEIRELYVDVNGTKYPVKQAFAEATGLHRGTFTSHDAMRVFRKLSIPIGPDVLTATERFYTVLKSLYEFDKQEVKGDHWCARKNRSGELLLGDLSPGQSQRREPAVPKTGKRLPGHSDASPK